MSAQAPKYSIRNLAQAASGGNTSTPSRLNGLFLQRVSAASGRRLQSHQARSRKG